ncbi:hypothetical protein D3C78_1116450 [compost metagenome]
MQALFAQVSPAIDPPKHRAAKQARAADPVDIGLHRTELLERRHPPGGAEVVSVALAARQIQAHVLPRAHHNVFDLQPAQFVTAKAAPEAQQDQRRITPAAQQAAPIARLRRLRALRVQLLDHLLQLAQLQRRGLLFPRRVQGADALQRLAYHRRLGRIGEALAIVPLGQRRQAQLEGVQRQLAGMAGQVARHALAGRRQEAAPLHLEVLDGGAIAAPGVVARGGLQVTIQLVHTDFRQ